MTLGTTVTQKDRFKMVSMGRYSSRERTTSDYMIEDLYHIL